jgi:hypothetical protein
MFREKLRNMTEHQRQIRFRNVGDPARCALLSTYEHGTDSPYVFYGNLMPFVARLEYLNLLDIFIADRPRVQTWWQHCKELTGYQKAIPNMLTEEDTLEMHASGTKIRDSIRAHRTKHLTQYKGAAHAA